MQDAPTLPVRLNDLEERIRILHLDKQCRRSFMTVIYLTNYPPLLAVNESGKSWFGDCTCNQPEHSFHNICRNVRSRPTFGTLTIRRATTNRGPVSNGPRAAALGEVAAAAAAAAAAACPYTLCARDEKRTGKATDFITDCKKEAVVAVEFCTPIRMDILTEDIADGANGRAKFKMVRELSLLCCPTNRLLSPFG